MTNHSRAEDVLFGSSNMIWDALAFRAAHVQLSSGKGGPKSIPQTPSQSSASCRAQPWETPPKYDVPQNDSKSYSRSNVNLLKVEKRR